MRQGLRCWRGVVLIGAALWAAVLAACRGPVPAGAEGAAPSVTVVAVHDGDTVRVRGADARVQVVRLATIDAPELDQPDGVAARDALRQRVLGQTVWLEPRGRDRYGRTLAVLWLPQEGGVADVALGAVEAGWAWHYGAHAHEQPVPERWRYALAETIARQQGRGLWQRADAVPPWEWRRRHRSSAGASFTEPPVHAGAEPVPLGASAPD